jgi:hypothetical protein
MSEPDPTYTATYKDVTIKPERDKPPEHLRLYLDHRRRVVIMELRELDRQLGRPQTIPERRELDKK